MRAIWSGVVSFGLVSVPVRLYAATASHDVRFHQVHEPDGGRIRYKRFCELCGAEVPYEDIVRGHETVDGEVVTLDDEDMASLPGGTAREISVLEFVPGEQVDPLLLDRSYYLEPDPKAVKPYALLREALLEADRMAVAKVTLRKRETLALLRVRGAVIVLQTLLWPDEVREPDFPVLRDEAELRAQELQMAATLVGTLRADFEPERFDDEYTRAMEELIDHKRRHGGAHPAPAASSSTAEAVTDLLTALQRSVEEASSRSGRKQSKTTRKPAGGKKGEAADSAGKTGGRSRRRA
ncbi:MAG: Ku protein [Pseudonocardiaceae bacterium]|nr:Ku protein [Pseudonocardiaceae bacterium]